MDNPFSLNALSFKVFSAKLNKVVKELPMAHPVKAADILCEQIDNILNIEPKTEQMLKTLENLTLPVNQVNIMLKKQLLSVSPLVAIQKKDVIAATLKLSLKFATVFASLLSTNAETPIVKKENRANIIIYSMFYLLEALLINYEVYMAVTEKLWFRLHTLYLLAENEGLLQLNINNTTHFNTIDQVYKTTILIATSSPYQLRRRDIERLYNIIIKWASNVDIVNNINDVPYILELHQDNPPIFKALFAGKNSHTIRGVSTDKFLNAISHIIKQHSNEISVQETALSKNVFEYIERSWGGTYERTNERTQKAGKLDVAFGISALHYFISGKNAYDFYSSFPDVENISNNMQDSKNEFTPFDLSKNQKDKWDVQYVNNDIQEEGKKQKYKLFNFEYDNESAGGICIKTTSTNVPLLHTGELIGMHQLTEDYQWSIGILRWLKQEKDGTLKIGVQTLASHALTIAVKIAMPDSEELSRALLLPEMPHHNQPSTIILPPKHYHPGTKLTVYYDKNHAQIVLIEPIVANEQFYQYSYQTEATALQKPQTEFNKRVDHEQLDNIWDDLIQ